MTPCLPNFRITYFLVSPWPLQAAQHLSSENLLEASARRFTVKYSDFLFVPMQYAPEFSEPPGSFRQHPWLVLLGLDPVQGEDDPLAL